MDCCAFLYNRIILFSGLYKNITGELSGKYHVEITPAGWTFSIWAVIYIWLGLWLMIYSISTICRYTTYGYFYVNPKVLPPSLYACFVINMGANIAWLFLWDRQYLISALVAMVVLCLTLAVCLLISLRGLYAYGTVYICEDTVKDVWFVRILVHNGLGLYFGWTTVALLLNLAVVLTYRGGVNQQVSSTVSLSILFLEILTLFFFDAFAWDRFSRYLITPYLVFIYALVGILYKNWDPTESNPVLAAALLFTASLLAIAKFILLVYKHFKYPVWARANIPDSFFEKKNSYGSTDYISL